MSTYSLPVNTVPSDSCKQPCAYMYMTMLERMFEDPMHLLQSFQIPYHRRRYLLKQWRNDRTRYLMEHCRDLDYMQDSEMEGLMLAITQLKQEPRKFA